MTDEEKTEMNTGIQKFEFSRMKSFSDEIKSIFIIMKEL